MAAHEISDGVNCCTPKGQLKRYLHCVGCDQKPSPSPEEQAAELYPITDWDDTQHRIVAGCQQAAWLSRQAEVDELKKTLDIKCNMIDILRKESFAKSDQLAAKDMEISEFKKQVSGLLIRLKSLITNSTPKKRR
jgi:hypothetical protein